MTKREQAKAVWRARVAEIAERGYVVADDYDTVGHAGVAYARRLIRELGTRDPGSTANERWAHCDATFEVGLLDKREREHERDAAQQAYWAERVATAKPGTPDTRYWDVDTWADAQQARELVDAQPGVTRTWVKRTATGYRITWNGPAFLTGDEVTHAERGGTGTVDAYKDGYYAVTWLGGRRGAYRAHELRRP
jgi:hypothetical protein